MCGTEASNDVCDSEDVTTGGDVCFGAGEGAMGFGAGEGVLGLGAGEGAVCLGGFRGVGGGVVPRILAGDCDRALCKDTHMST